LVAQEQLPAVLATLRGDVAPSAAATPTPAATTTPLPTTEAVPRPVRATSHVNTADVGLPAIVDPVDEQFSGLEIVDDESDEDAWGLTGRE
jgi:S-DNA-T family DNA segregation ATPase FtsK/SpoIIIE